MQNIVLNFRSVQKREINVFVIDFDSRLQKEELNVYYRCWKILVTQSHKFAGSFLEIIWEKFYKMSRNVP